MSIITPKMITTNEDFIGPNCAVFFPMNEGSGDTITDIANGYSFTKASTAHTLAHAINQNFSNTNRTDSNVVSITANKHILVFLVGKALINNSLFAASYGSATASDGFVINVGAVTASIDSGTPAVVGATMDTITTNDTVLVATTFNTTTGELRSYNGINGASVVFANTADASVHLPNIQLVSNTMIIGSTLAQGLMAYGVLFLDTLPVEAELLDMLEVTHQNIISGRKYYDSRLSDY